MIAAFVLTILLFTYVHSKNVGRTAVCLTGRLDTVNLPWKDLKPHHYYKEKRSDILGPTMNIIENILIPLSQNGNVDVFVLVQTTNESTVINPLVGDVSACKPFKDNRIFNENSGNKFFCNVEKESILLNEFMKKSSVWQYFDKRDHPETLEAVLQQAYGMYKCNQGVHVYLSTLKGVNNNTEDYYKYKMRLRTDIIFDKLLPDVSTLGFVSAKTDEICHKYVDILNYGATEDTFAVGDFDAMDAYLNHYESFLYPDKYLENVSQGPNWNNERHLMRYMEVHHVCVLKDSLLPQGATARAVQHESVDDKKHAWNNIESDWKELV